MEVLGLRTRPVSSQHLVPLCRHFGWSCVRVEPRPFISRPAPFTCYKDESCSRSKLLELQLSLQIDERASSLPLSLFSRVGARRFTASESVSGSSQAKASVVRGIRAKLTEQYPQLADYIDEIIPKKEPIQIVKWYRSDKCTIWSMTYHILPYSHDHIEILARKNELFLFRQRDGPYIPTLRLLHKCEGQTSRLCYISICNTLHRAEIIWYPCLITNF